MCREKKIKNYSTIFLRKIFSFIYILFYLFIDCNKLNELNINISIAFLEFWLAEEVENRSTQEAQLDIEVVNVLSAQTFYIPSSINQKLYRFFD